MISPLSNSDMVDFSINLKWMRLLERSFHWVEYAKQIERQLTFNFVYEVYRQYKNACCSEKSGGVFVKIAYHMMTSFNLLPKSPTNML